MLIDFRSVSRLLLCGLCLSAPVPSGAWPELDIHGALAQGYLRSYGNSVRPDSEEGTADFREVVVNGRSLIGGKVLLSGQLIALSDGAADDGKLRLDYLQLDYLRMLTEHAGVGLRLGRVKNPYGLYNSTRDVVFSRPSIIMPTSVYYAGAGLRNLFFSNDGAQLYALHNGQRFTQDWIVGIARGDSVAKQLRTAVAPATSTGPIDVSGFFTAQWLIENASGRGFRGGLSYLGADAAYRSTGEPGDLPSTHLDADIGVASAQWREQAYTITAEYRYSRLNIETAGFPSRQRSEGAYVQWRGMLNPRWEIYARYDWSVLDSRDRDGRDYASQTGRPRHERFSRDVTLGLSFAPTASWGAFAEWHGIDGTADAARSSDGEPGERRWQVLYLMLAYRF